MDTKKIDFLAIGDIVIDAFIKLKDAHIHCKIDTDACELCVPFGDKIPYESVDVLNAVGNSPNAAVAAARMDLSSTLITNIGDDINGKECLESLKKDKVSTDFVSTEKGKKTNYHYVLWYGVERTILVKHALFNYLFPDFNDTEISWIYLSSLAENSLPYHLEIAKFLKNNPKTKLAFQPGTFQMKFGTENLKEIYEHTEVFFCNLEEAEKILNIPARNTSHNDAGGQNKDIKILLEKLHKLGPKIVCISDGPNGAYASDARENKSNIWYTPMYPDTATPVDRTGAGDAFSSTFTIALALGKTIPEALAWGPINSMSVVQYIGAQAGLLTRSKLEEFLKNAPENYKVQKIN